MKEEFSDTLHGNGDTASGDRQQSGQNTAVQLQTSCSSEQKIEADKRFVLCILLLHDAALYTITSSVSKMVACTQAYHEQGICQKDQETQTTATAGP